MLKGPTSTVKKKLVYGLVSVNNHQSICIYSSEESNKLVLMYSAVIRDK